LSSTYLKEALNSPPYDFSAIYAISHWLIDILDQCPSRSTHILELGKALHSEVSLSTGLGLFAVWSRFYAEEPPLTFREATQMTDRLAASLGHSTDSPGEFEYA
jgi:midasin